MEDFLFGDNASVGDINTVPEQFRSAYVQQGDAYVINEALKPYLDVADGRARLLKVAKADKARAMSESAQRRQQIDQWAALGFESPEAAKAAYDELKSKKGIDPEAIKTAVAKSYEDKLVASDTKIANMRKTMEGYVIDGAAATAIAEEKGVSALLMPIVRSNVSTIENEDGTYSAVFRDQDNNIRISPDTGRPLTIKEFVANLKKDKTYAGAFEGNGGGGGGTPPARQVAQQQQRGNGGTELSATQKIALGLKQGQVQSRRRG